MIRGVLVIFFHVVLYGCATNTAKTKIPNQSDYDLCGDFKRYGVINVNQGLRKEEIARRELDCDSTVFAKAEADSLTRYEKRKQLHQSQGQSTTNQTSNLILQGFKNASELANEVHRAKTIRSSNHGDSKKFEGWSLVHVGKITGYIDKKDDSKAQSFSFEGCDYGRILVVDLTRKVVCKEYKYHYAYNPEIKVFSKSGSQYRALIDGEIFEVSRQ